MLIGIDLGTTALKVAAFDTRNGRLLHGVSKRLRVDLDDIGRREQSPESIERALVKAFAELGDRYGGLEKVRGVGVAAQGGSSSIVDRDTGTTLAPMTLWNDSTAIPEFQTLAQSKSPNYWRKFSLRDEPGMGLARIQRMRRTAPHLLDKNNLFIGVGEFLYHRLTGEWRQDAGNALQIGCYDARHRKLVAGPAKLAGVPLSFFAPMRQGDETHALSAKAAKRFGLPEGIPVAGPYMDHEAGFMSTAHVSTNPMQCSLGTAWVGNFCVPDASAARSPIQLVVPSPTETGDLIVQPLLTGNTTWDWALSCFVDKNHKLALAKQETIFANALLPPEGLVALPWLNQPNPLSPGTHGACSFVGAGPSTTQADFVRAVAAGMCYEFARVFETVKNNRLIDSLVLSGGASKGLHFQSMITALFDPLPVYLITEEDWGGSRGSLRPFSHKVSKGKTKRLRVSKKFDADGLRQGQTAYLNAFEALCSNVPAGKGFSYTVPKEKR